MGALTLVAGNAIIRIMIMVLVGIIFTKLGIIDEKITAAASTLLLMVINPINLLSSYLGGYDAEKAKGLFISMGLCVVMMLFAIAESFIAVKKGAPDWEVERACITFGNLGFMGIPIVTAIVGSEAVFYMSTLILIQNVFMWTYGIMLMSGESAGKDTFRKILHIPTIICILIGMVIFFTRIPVPEIVSAPLKSIAGSTTPVAMIISGSIIARSNLKEVFGHARILLISAIRLIISPLLMLLVLKLLPLPQLLSLTVFIAAGTPSATNNNIFAVRYGKNAGYATGIFTMTTFACMFTIPALVILYNLVM
jgi:predicted permease